MTKDKWFWMPHPAHLIVARDCKFHLATYVGKYIVSTVGEYYPPKSVREITGQKDGEYEEIGAGRKYETYVFKAQKDATNLCCKYEVSDYSEVDGRGCNDASEATKNHYIMCVKWSKK